MHGCELHEEEESQIYAEDGEREQLVGREWAFQKLLHCVETRANAKTCGVLILGGPGSGKTALCREIVWSREANLPAITSQPAGADNSTRGTGSSIQGEGSSVHGTGTSGQGAGSSSQGPGGANSNPGAGSSKQHVHRKLELHKRLLAFHFCDASEPATLCVWEFVWSLQRQLLSSEVGSLFAGMGGELDACRAPLRLDACRAPQRKATVDDAFEECILAPLRRLTQSRGTSPTGKNLCILVDGLDESLLFDGQLAMQALEGMRVRSSPPKILPTEDTSGGGSNSRAEGERQRDAASVSIAQLLIRAHREFPTWLTLICSLRKQSKWLTRQLGGFRVFSSLYPSLFKFDVYPQ